MLSPSTRSRGEPGPVGLAAALIALLAGSPGPRARPVVPEPAAAAPAPPPVAVVATPLAPVRPLYRRWWVWAAAGGVVAAAVASTLLLSRSSYQKDGSLGTLGPR